MICREDCPKNTECKPLSNVVADDNSTFVCIGLHGEVKIGNNDKFRHCFKSVTTDTVYDYDQYDLKSVISVMADALLIEELQNI